MKKKDKTKFIHGMLFILIPVIFITMFSFVPMFQSLLLSFKTGKGVVLKNGGLINYNRLFKDPVFATAVKNTFIYLIIQVPIMTLLALTSAAVLNNPNLKARGFFRVCIFLPCVTSLVAASVLFKSLFSTDGLINTLLVNIHFINAPIAWLYDPFWAKVTIILVLTWRWTGYDMIFYLASMQNIDKSIYEAATLDGASKTRQFFNITVPLLKPILLLTTIMSTNGTLQLFDEVATLTNGGPNNATLTISKYIYDLSFKFSPNFPYAATVAFAIFVMVAILSFIQFRVTREKK